MKKYLWYILSVFLLIGCQSNETKGNNDYSQQNSQPRFTGLINDTALNNAIVESYRYISNRINVGAVIGIGNVHSPTRELSEYYIDGLTKQIVDNNRYKLVDIGNLRIIEQEMSRHLSGNISDETAKRIGHQYGTDFIVIGNISQLGTTRTYRIKITITNVETTQIQGMCYADIKSNNELARFLPEHISRDNSRGSLPDGNISNDNQRLYYFRNITSQQFSQLFTVFKDEIDNNVSKANIINGGTIDPYIELKIEFNVWALRKYGIITIAGPFYTEIYELRGTSGYDERSIMNRLSLEKQILNDRYGNPDISMFFNE
jgi:hypothetical protein